jgi:micrococcal nuclease
MPRLVPTLLVLCALTGCPRSAEIRPEEVRPAAPRNEVGSAIVLDGQETAVRWSDGDSFRILSGPRKGVRVRLSGFNTLEDYGPIHRWGTWTPIELYRLAKRAGLVAGERKWTCSSVGEQDSYGRLLVDCPEAARELLREGLAMAFSVDGPSPPDLLQAQQEAQKAGRGMWRGGVPDGIVTSLHSASERTAYNRVADTRTGHAAKVPHQQRYELCQEVCVGEGEAASCMIYVPYEQRYGKGRAACLRLPARQPGANEPRGP